MKSKPAFRLAFPLASAIAALLAAPSAFAADGTWLGATGNWNAAGTWSGGTIADGTGFTANFTGVNITVARTITLAADRTIGHIIFTDPTLSSHNLTISGANILTMDVSSGVPSIDVTQSDRAITISSVIAGNEGLEKKGAGLLLLQGTNNYTGATTVSAGNLAIQNYAGLDNTSSITVSGGSSILEFRVVGAGATSDTINKAISLNGTLRTAGGTAANTLALTWDGNITLAGNSTVNNHGNGSIDINGLVDLAANTLTFQTDQAGSRIDGVISGIGGGLIKTGTQLLTITGANTYTGTTNISTGTLVFGSTGALGSTSGITIGGAAAATLQSTTDGITIAAPITTADTGINSNIVFGRATAAAGSLNLNGAIGGAGNVIFSTPNVSSGGQAQTINLGAAGTYAGNTTITTGNLNNLTVIKAGVVNALPATTVLTMAGGAASNTAAGRTVSYDLNGNNQTLAGLTNTTADHATSRNQRVTNSGALATLTVNNTADSSYGGQTTDAEGTGSAQISGAIALTKNGAGTFTLGGTLGGTTTSANALGNSYTGDTKILGGILALGVTHAIRNSAFDTANSITGTTTGGLRTTVTTLTLGGLTGGNDFSTRFTTTAGGYDTVTALTLNPGTGTTPSYSGAIADGAGGMTLTKTGTGTQTLSGANTFTGATAVNVGNLTLDYSTQDNSKLSDTAALTLGAVTLDLSGGTHLEIVDSTMLTAGTASKVTRSSGSAILQMNAITNGALASIDFSQSGIATTDTLNNASGILGPWATIGGGTQFAVNSSNTADGLITAATSTDVTRLNGGTQVIADSAASNVRITEGSGSPANLTLAAATTTIGTLTQSASGGNSAATIDSGGQTLLTSAILVGTGAGSLTIGNGTLGTATAGGDLALVNTTASGFTVNSVIANNTSASTLSKLGTGPVTLTNANTYTGATTISAGSFHLGAGGATGSLDPTGAITLANSSSNLTINRSNAATQGTDFSGAPLTGTGSFSQAGAGTTTLNAINTYSGPTTIAAGTLNANSTDALGSGVFGNTLIFTGGTLQAAGTITSPSTRAVSLTSTGVIDTNGNDVSFAGVASGVGGLTKNGAGTLTSSAINTFTGPITINGGTLEFSGASSGNNPYLSTQININNGSTLRITGASGNQPIYDGRNYTFDATGGGSILVSTGNYNAVSTPFSITTLGGAANTIGLITTSGAFGFNLGATNCTFDVALGSDATSDLTVTPIIANTGSVLKTGAGRLTLTGANTYSGTTTINAGTLRVSGGSALPGAVTLADVAGATLQVVTSEAVTGIVGGGAIGGSVSIDSAQTLSLASGTHTYAGTIGGAGTLTNAGANQTLNGALSQTGGVNVTTGTLTLGSSASTYAGTTAISAAAAGVIVTANNALGATGTGNDTTVGAAGVLGLSGGINYSAAEKVIGSGNGNSAADTPAGFTIGNRGFIQSVNGNNTFAGNIELNANGVSRIGTQDGAQLTLTGAITQGSGITTANILFRVGNLAGDFVTLANAGNSFGGDSTVFTGVTNTDYAGVRLGINNALPTNLAISGFTGTNATFTSLDLAGFNQSLNGLISGAGALQIINRNMITPSTLTLNPTADKSTTNTNILGGGALGVINVEKTGSFTQTLSTINTYTGTTTINAGALELGVTASIATSASVSIAAGATLDTDAQATYTLLTAQPLALGIDASASGSSGKITAAGLNITDAVVTYNITGTPDDPVYILATYTSLTGATFASVPAPPAGYTLQYAHEGNKIALVQSVGTTYATWIAGFPGVGLLNGVNDDPDFDGIDNGMEMVLGGNPSTGMDTALLPTIELVTNPVSIPAIPAGNYLLFTYRRTDISEDALVAAACETDTDLVAPWTTAVNAVSGVVIQEDLNFSFTPAAPADTDRVRVYVPRGANTKLFGRLNVVVP